IDLAADLARMLGDIETLYDAHARTAGEQVVGDVAVGVADGRDRTDAGDPNCRLMIHGFFSAPTPLRSRCFRPFSGCRCPFLAGDVAAPTALRSKSMRTPPLLAQKEVIGVAAAASVSSIAASRNVLMSAVSTSSGAW